MSEYRTDEWNSALGAIIHGERVSTSDVNACVRFIEAVAHDPEIAHGREDSLWESVLEAIADGRCVDAGDCAEAALETRLTEFSRWCA